MKKYRIPFYLTLLSYASIILGFIYQVRFLEIILILVILVSVSVAISAIEKIYKKRDRKINTALILLSIPPVGLSIGLLLIFHAIGRMIG